jgi:thiol:disulfide interchange protein DsbC
MMNKPLAALLGFSLMQATLAAPPLPQPATPEGPSSFTARLQTLYPGTRFGQISGTDWPGVFEVAMGDNLAYVDASGRYFLFGHLYDMKAQRDLTAERESRRHSVDFSKLPLADAIPEVRGKGTRKLAVFSDPDCRYCRQLEGELKTLDDVAIYRFLLPLASLHPEARSKAVAIWCASDRLKAWQGLLQGMAPTGNPDCAHPIDRNIALANELQIFGTPTLIAGDGRLMPGMASAAEIERWLGAAKGGAVAISTPQATSR